LGLTVFPFGVAFASFAIGLALRQTEVWDAGFGLCLALGLACGAPVIVAVYRLSDDVSLGEHLRGLVFGILGAIAGVFASVIGYGVTLPGHGRPLRRGGRSVSASEAESGEWVRERMACDGEPRIDAGLREAIAESWLVAARLEHASIASFAHLALDLLATGAPPDLVRRAHDAARDEVDHARDAYAVASTFAGRSLGPTELPEARSFNRETMATTLRRIGVEAIVDGVVGEGAAARALSEAAEVCVDRRLAEVLRRASVDEARHADLAWDVFVWVRARGVRGLERQVDEALSKLWRSTSRTGKSHDASIDLSRFGRLSDGLEASIVLEAIEHVRARIAAGSGGPVVGKAELPAS
jgi:hypothetical protein